MSKSFDVAEIGFPIGGLPARIQDVPCLLVFTDKGIALLLYGTWKSFLPAGVILDMKELIRVAKGGGQAIHELLMRGKGITLKEFVPYSEVKEVKMERRSLNRTVIAVEKRDGKELTVRMIAGKGMGITREEYLELFKEICRKIPVRASLNLEELK